MLLFKTRKCPPKFPLLELRPRPVLPSNTSPGGPPSLLPSPGPGTAITENSLIREASKWTLVPFDLFSEILCVRE